jgi:tRNA A-37 threonylcarbamoyl transferase component Bud32
MPGPIAEAEAELVPLVPSDGLRGFGRYQLLAKLGSGGQADVYLAAALGTLGVDKLVVIKRAKPGLAADDARLGIFLDEARLTLRLNHPNIVHTYEVGEEEGVHFISMEYVEGLSLEDLFRYQRTRTFGPAIWLRVIADALSGLSHAHGLRDYDGTPLDIVHRDISPHNILVSYDGVTKIVDFGIAKASLTSSTTEPDVLKGKAAYMAPEQALGKTDRRSDVFAMGVVLWELLAGRRLFDGDSLVILQRLLHEPIPRLRTALPDTDAELDDLVARALEKEPDARYQSANEMRQAIERYLRKTGQVVREPEVGEAIATAFADERAKLAARIQQAMARMSGAPGRSGELPAVRGSAPPSYAEPGRAAASERATKPDLPARGAASGTASEAARRRRQRTRAVLTAGGLALACALALLLAARWRGRATGGHARDAGEPRAGAELAPDHRSPPARCTAPLHIRVMYDMTGATKDVGTAAGKGAYDYLRAIDEAGGIRGCKLDLDVQDTRYDKRASLEIYAAWKARPDWAAVSAIFVQGTPMTQALGPLAAHDEKVVISTAYAGELAAPRPTSAEVEVPSLSDAFVEASVWVHKQSPGYPYVFFQGTDYTTAARVGANFAWRQGARRMAFFYCSTSPFCTDPVDGAKTFLKRLGGTRIGRDLFLELDDDAATIERKVARFFQQERQHRAAHPDYEIVDWIWFGNTSANSAWLGRALARAKQQHAIDVHLIGNNWAVDESLHARCGEACAGFHAVQPFAMFGDLTAAGTAGLLADHARYRKLDGEPEGAHRTVHYVYGRVAVAAWKLAVERLLDQGRPVTGPNLRAMLETFRQVDVEGFAAISYSPTDHRPQSGARITQLGAAGRIETIGPPLSLTLQPGWLGW